MDDLATVQGSVCQRICTQRPSYLPAPWMDWAQLAENDPTILAQWGETILVQKNRNYGVVYQMGGLTL